MEKGVSKRAGNSPECTTSLVVDIPDITIAQMRSAGSGSGSGGGGGVGGEGRRPAVHRRLGWGAKEVFARSLTGRMLPVAGTSAQVAKALLWTDIVKGHTGCVNRLTWSKDGRVLASVSDDLHINMATWSGQQVQKEHRVHTGHRNNIFGVALVDGGGDDVVTCGLDGQVRVTNVETGVNSLVYGDRPGDRDVGRLFMFGNTRVMKNLAMDPVAPKRVWAAEQSNSGKGLVSIDLRAGTSTAFSATALGEDAQPLNDVAVNPLYPNYVLVALGGAACARLLDQRMLGADSAALPILRSFCPMGIDSGENRIAHRCATKVDIHPDGRHFLMNVFGSDVFEYEMFAAGDDPLDAGGRLQRIGGNVAGVTGFVSGSWPPPSSSSCDPTAVPHVVGAQNVVLPGDPPPAVFKGVVARLKQDGVDLYMESEYLRATVVFGQAIAAAKADRSLCNASGMAILYTNRAASTYRSIGGAEGMLDMGGAPGPTRAETEVVVHDAWTALSYQRTHWKAGIWLAQGLVHSSATAASSLLYWLLRHPNEKCVQMANGVLRAHKGAIPPPSPTGPSSSSLPAEWVRASAEATVPAFRELFRPDVAMRPVLGGTTGELMFTPVFSAARNRYTGRLHATTNIQEAVYGGLNGDLVFSGCDGGTVMVFDRDSRAPEVMLKADCDVVNVIRPNPVDPNVVAVSGIDNTVKLWSPRPKKGGWAAEDDWLAPALEAGALRTRALSLDEDVWGVYRALVLHHRAQIKSM